MDNLNETKFTHKNESTDHKIGYVHSLQSMGAVDGPGIRFCVFLQGCPLRCMYCHNPDTWLVEVHDTDGAVPGVRDNSSCMKRLGTPYTAEELVKKILRYKPYFANGGGVTVSGGEPLVQAEFVTELFTLLHENGVHTCLDTSGNFPEDICELEHKNVGETIRRADSSDIPVTDSDDGFADIVEIYRETSVREKYDALLAVTDLVICDIKFTTEKTTASVPAAV